MYKRKGGTSSPPLDSPYPVRPAFGRAHNGLRTPLWRKQDPAPRGWVLFTRRSVSGIFRHVHAAAKNDPTPFRRKRRKPGRGDPFLDFPPWGTTTRRAAPSPCGPLPSAWPPSGSGGGSFLPKGSLVQRELSAARLAEGLSEVAGHFGDDLCSNFHPSLATAAQTLRSALLARVVGGASCTFRRGRCPHQPVAWHHLCCFRRAEATP